MQAWLVICLKAPLASFGDNAGNAERDSSDMPTRSALIGLAAAALGIRREDAEGQARLAAGVVTAAALYERGHPLVDFHTFQSLHQAAKGAATRAEALRKTAHLETSISRRHYRSGGLWQAAYRLSETERGTSLEALRLAFSAPAFVLYLGRKSCPLSHPLAPLIVDAPTVVEAFQAQFATVAATVDRYGRARLRTVSVEHEDDGPQANRSSIHTRHDDPRDRSKGWTFGDRAEWRFVVSSDRQQEGQA